MTHQPTTFRDLSPVESIALTCKRIFSLPEFKPHGCSNEAEFSAKIISKETFIRPGYRVDLISMNHNRRRILTAEMCEP